MAALCLLDLRRILVNKDDMNDNATGGQELEWIASTETPIQSSAGFLVMVTLVTCSYKKTLRKNRSDETLWPYCNCCFPERKQDRKS